MGCGTTLDLVSSTVTPSRTLEPDADGFLLRALNCFAFFTFVLFSPAIDLFQEGVLLKKGQHLGVLISFLAIFASYYF